MFIARTIQNSNWVEDDARIDDEERSILGKKNLGFQNVARLWIHYGKLGFGLNCAKPIEGVKI